MFTFSGDLPSSKYGAKFDTSQFVWLPPHIRQLAECSISASTWSTYKTAITTYENFLAFHCLMLLFPIPATLLEKFVVYLFKFKCLAPGTINNYLSGLQFFHKLSNHSLKAFKSPRLLLVLTGISNLYKINAPSSGKVRCAMTFDALKVFGHEIYHSYLLSDFDKQVLWTISLLSYWGSFRLGDFLPGSYGRDEFRILKWSKIHVFDKNHLTVFISVPKVHKDMGHVKDFFRQDDKTYCPVYNLLCLYRLVSVKPNFDLNNPVFLKENNYNFTIVNMRTWLKKLLCPVLGNHFNAHSFRSGVPSLMAAHPLVFSKSEIMDRGVWSSDAYKAYIKSQGIGRAHTNAKLQALH